MRRRRVNLVKMWLTLANFLVPSVAFLLAGYIRFASGYFYEVDVDVYSYAALVIVVTVAWASVVEHYKLNEIGSLSAIRVGVRETAKATGVTMALVLAVTFFYRDAAFSRIFVGSGCVLIYAISLAVLQLFRKVVFGWKAPWAGRFRIAILGADEHAARVAQRLSETPFLPSEVVCFVALPGQVPVRTLSGPVIEWDHLEEVVDTFQAQELLVALLPGRFAELQELLDRAQGLCVPVRVVLDLGEGVFVPERVFDFYGIPLLDVRPYAVETVHYVLFKRIFDIAFALLGLIVTAPVTAIIALAIKLTSPGPILFAQERVSLNGRRFKMLKFRTMRVQDDDGSNTHHTARGDPRITTVGQLLRKTSLDELPQFLNVLRGEMSIVGPRPELTYFVQQFREKIPVYMARHNVKCGITGWAQINGLRGSDSSIPERIEHDLYYLRNWSLGFDIKIICLTLLRGFSSKGAY